MAGTGKSGGADINVVPLIDIVLVLLIIFMVITPLIVKQMDLNIPDDEEVAEVPQEVPKDQVVVLMDKDGRIFMNKEEIPLEQIEMRLKGVFGGRPYEERVMFFDAEDATNYKATVKVLDLARGAGVAKIGLITNRAIMAPVPVPGAPGDPAAPGAPGSPVPPPGVPGAPQP